jgi:hypothetical protein
MSRYIPMSRNQRMEMQQKQMPNQILLYFHKHNLNKIKQALGSNCTYVGHVTVNKNELVPKVNAEGKKDPNMLVLKEKQSVHYLVAKFGNSNRDITAVLNGTPNDIKAEYYAQLKNDLTNAARERGLL